jgi:hypothetical protein
MRSINIQPGQWVAVIRCLAAPVEITIDFSGRPLMVLAVSLPFVAVRDGDMTTTVDTRFWELGKVSEEYANAMMGVSPQEPERPDESACPQCGTRLCQRNLRGAWRMWCRECKYEGSVIT